MANLMAMAIARDVHLARLRGLDHPPRGAELEGARIYVSDQAHFSFERGLAVLGLPDRDAGRACPPTSASGSRPVRSPRPSPRDRAAGLTPLAIVATAGTTNTGSVDAVADLADAGRARGPVVPRGRRVRRCRAALRARCRPRAGPRARRLRHHRPAQVVLPGLRHRRPPGPRRLAARGHVLASARVLPRWRRPDAAPDAHGSGELDFYRLGVEGTRRFRALKLWLSWKHLGTRGLGRLVEMNDDLAAALAGAIAASPDFEACPAEPELSVVCFRHLPDGRDGADQAGATPSTSTRTRCRRPSSAAAAAS